MARQLGLPLFMNEENPGATPTPRRVTTTISHHDEVIVADVARPDTRNDTNNHPD